MNYSFPDGTLINHREIKNELFELFLTKSYNKTPWTNKNLPVVYHRELFVCPGTKIFHRLQFDKFFEFVKYKMKFKKRPPGGFCLSWDKQKPPGGTTQRFLFVLRQTKTSRWYKLNIYY